MNQLINRAVIKKGRVAMYSIIENLTSTISALADKMQNPDSDIAEEIARGKIALDMATALLDCEDDVKGLYDLIISNMVINDTRSDAEIIQEDMRRNVEEFRSLSKRFMKEVGMKDDR